MTLPRHPDGSLSRMLADLSDLAHPRASGGPGERRARRHVAHLLASMGLSVREEPFRFGRRVIQIGYPAVALLAALALVLSALTLHPGFWLAVALGLTLPAAVVAGVAAPRLAVGSEVESANLVAARSPAAGLPEPASGSHVVVMAHIDSKSQRLSFAGRSVWTGVALAGVVAYAVALVLGGHGGVVATVLAIGAAGALGVVAAAGYGDESPGALDNATGVVALLELARRFQTVPPPGLTLEFVVTGAEEDGLVGADRWAARARPRLDRERTLVVNLDTVGGMGPLILTGHARATGSRADEIRRFGERARALGIVLVSRRVPFPGAVDSFAVGRRGFRALTLASGTLRSTYRYLHRPSDDLSRVSPDTLLAAVDLVEDVVRRLAPPSEAP